MPGAVMKVTRPVSYVVQLTRELLVRRHVNQLQLRVGRMDYASLQHPNDAMFPYGEEASEPVDLD